MFSKKNALFGLISWQPYSQQKAPYISKSFYRVLEKKEFRNYLRIVVFLTIGGLSRAKTVRNIICVVKCFFGPKSCIDLKYHNNQKSWKLNKKNMRETLAHL